MEWLRGKLAEMKEQHDSIGAYCYYIGVLEQCIKDGDLDRAQDAVKIGEEELWKAKQ